MTDMKEQQMSKRLLWVGDAGCPSGFAGATHHILETVSEALHTTVLGINYNGDPHDFPYEIYTAFPGGDLFGVLRLVWMCDRVNPDVIVVQQDGWNIQKYVHQLRRFDEFAQVPVIAIVAVDGENFQGEWLDGVALAIFWTEFALAQARAGGYTGEAAVIPLGVDTSVYYQVDKAEARSRRKLPQAMREGFIVGNVNRDQPRKRWDLTIRYFALWVKQHDVHDAWLYLHKAPTGERTVNVGKLAAYYGVADRVCLIEPETFYGLPTDEMRDTYNCFDVQVSTTQGEGFGLTTFEGMACCVPQEVPRWSALAELLAPDAGRLVSCTSTAVGQPYVDVVGGIADEREFIAHLAELYNSPSARHEQAMRGFARASEARYDWRNIGEAYLTAIQRVLD